MTRPHRTHSILTELTLEQKIAQLLHPFVHPSDSSTDPVSDFNGLTPGGCFFMPSSQKEMLQLSTHLQSSALMPIVISSDLECGPGRMIKDATVFPDIMAVAATGKPELAYEMGKAAAIEGLAAGVHWNFAPVIDINKNSMNPITNTRSLGDDPQTIACYAWEFIRGMQDHQMAGCAKHFPGDGFDARDQHICTSINPLSTSQWNELSGDLFRQVISKGVWSIMIGHIALPSVDPGDGTSLSAAPPATLSKLLTTDLLRNQLGFQGMVVSDASFMGGLTSWGAREQIVPKVIEAGCDQLLFCDFKGDFEILMNAVEKETLSMERVDEAVERVLAFKETLGLFDRVIGKKVSQSELADHQRASIEVARSAITVAADRHSALPPALRQGSRVLSCHLRGDPLYHVDEIDDMMRKEGYDVVRKTEEEEWSLMGKGDLDEFDLILVNLVFGPSWNTNRIRPNGNYLRELILNIPFHDPRVVFVSYGTPYLLYDFPRLPALLNVYSPDKVTQRAVVDYLRGKVKAVGTSPVRLNADPDWFQMNQ